MSDCISAASQHSHATADISCGDVIAIGSRKVQVQGTEFLTPIRDYRGRIAVRNLETNRLSYIPEWRLRVAIAKSEGSGK